MTLELIAYHTNARGDLCCSWCGDDAPIDPMAPHMSHGVKTTRAWCKACSHVIELSCVGMTDAELDA